MRATACWSGRERDVRVLGQPRDGALDAAAARVAPRAAAAARRARARAPAAPSTAAAARRAGPRRRPAAPRPAPARRSARRAAPAARSRAAARRATSARRARGWRRARATARGRRRSGRRSPRARRPRRPCRRGRRARSAATNSARSRSSSHAVNSSSNWSTASTPRRSRSSRRVARRSSRERVRAGPDHGLRPVLAAGQHAARERGQQARRAPPRTCRCPTGRRPPAAARRRGARRARRRAARGRRSSRRRRRRTVARPLYGQTTAVVGGVARASGALARRLQLDDAAGQLVDSSARASAAPGRGAVGRARRRGGSPRGAPTRSPPRGRGAATPRLVASSVVDRDRRCRRARRSAAIAPTPSASSGSSTSDSRGSSRASAAACRPGGEHEHRHATRASSVAQRGADVERARGRRRRARAASAGARRARARSPPARPPAVPCRPRRARSAPSPWASRASSAATRVLPIPYAPTSVTSAPAPAAARRQRARSRRSSSSRPISGGAAARVELARAARRRPARRPARGPGAGSRRAGGCSSGRGSTPISSTSVCAGVPVGLERLGLAAAAVEREHPLRVQALAQRVARPAARRSRRRPPGGGRRPGRRRSPARRRSAAAPRAGGSRRSANGSSATSASGSPRNSASACARRVPRLAVSAARAASATSRSRRQRVDQLAVDPQLVRAPARDDLGAAVVGQHLAQPPDVVLDHLGRARRRLLAPQALDQPVGGDRAGWPRARASPAPRAASPRRARPGGRRRWPRGGPRTRICMERRVWSAGPNPITSCGSRINGHGAQRWRALVYGWSTRAGLRLAVTRRRTPVDRATRRCGPSHVPHPAHPPPGRSGPHDERHRDDVVAAPARHARPGHQRDRACTGAHGPVLGRAGASRRRHATAPTPLLPAHPTPGATP